MITRIIRWAAVVFSVVAFQGLLAEHLTPGGVGLRWSLLVIMLAGLTGGPTRGIIAGGLVGFVTDCLTPSFLGWGMMVKLLIGAGVGMSRERLFLERGLSRWLVLASAVLLHDLIYLLPVTGFDIGLYFRTLWPDSLISATITSVVGVVMLLAWRSFRRPLVTPESGKTSRPAAN